MNALRLAAFAFVAAIFFGSNLSPAQAQFSESKPLVEYEVVVDVRVVWNGSNGQVHVWSGPIVVLKTMSKIEADDLAEMLYLTWQIDHETADNFVKKLLDLPLSTNLRVEGVSVRTVENWRFEKQYLSR